MTSDRDKKAKLETQPQINKNLLVLGLNPNLIKVYMRAFKSEEILEVWVSNNEKYLKYASYPFCTSSGTLGPKRKEGDNQIPEGCYTINRYNPKSKFYLSMGINYPNESDLLFAYKDDPGSDIFIHGGCSSVGCISITNNKIKEVYTLASIARDQGQQNIRVDIYPYQFKQKLEDDNSVLWESHQNLWSDLKSIYHDFENTKTLSEIYINHEGRYFNK